MENDHTTPHEQLGTPLMGNSLLNELPGEPTEPQAQPPTPPQPPQSPYPQTPPPPPPINPNPPQRPKKSGGNTALWIIIALLGLALIALIAIKFWPNEQVEDIPPEQRITDTEAMTEYDEDYEYADTSVELTTEVEEEDVTEEDPIMESSHYSLTGYVTDPEKGKDYPIRMYLTIDENGSLSGRYAYDLTLNKYGDVPSSWFTLTGGRYQGDVMRMNSYLYGKSEPFEFIELNLGSSTVRGRLQNLNNYTELTITLR